MRESFGLNAAGRKVLLTGIAGPLRSLFMLALLPNLLMALAVTLLHGSRALINLDYVVIAALDRFVSRVMLVVLLTLALLLDVAFTFAPAFNFGPGEVVAAVSQLRNFSGRAIVIALGVIGFIALLARLIVRARGTPTDAGRRWTDLAVCGAFAAACLAADIVNGTHAITWRARPAIPIDIATSTFSTQFAGAPTMPPTSGKLAAATDGLRASLGEADGGSWNGPEKIVLVVVEAMGSPRGVRLGSLFAPLLRDSVTRRFETRTGTVPFFGATTSGELRELCGVAMNHLGALGSDLRCLPTQLRALGYESLALHGYDGSLFQRDQWWPRVGFDRIVFRRELQQPRRHPECGILFHGVCDSSMVAVLRDELVRAPGRRRFIYWLTLSSHFPLDRRAETAGPACSALGAIGRESEVCSLWNAIWPVLDGIAGIAADPAVPPAWYIVVGDHAPPRLFSDTTLFDQRRVPFIELRPLARARAAR